MSRGITYTAHEIGRVERVLLRTWQSVIAISEHAGLEHRKTLAIIKERKLELGIETRDGRLDGHNPVWLVRLKPQGGM